MKIAYRDMLKVSIFLCIFIGVVEVSVGVGENIKGEVARKWFKVGWTRNRIVYTACNMKARKWAGICEILYYF